MNSLIVKENRGGFFGRIDVDLLVSSMKGATIMKSMQEENIKYDKFEKDIMNAFLMRGMMGVTEYLAKWK